MHLSPRTHLTLGLATVMALMLVVSTVAVRELRISARHTDQLARASVPEARALGEISTQVYALRSAQSDLLAGGRRLLAVREPVVDEKVEAMRRAIARYGAVLDTPEDRRRLAGLNATWASYVYETAGLADEVRAGDYPAAQAVLSRPTPLFERALAQLRALTTTEDGQLHAAVTAARSGAVDAKNLTIDLTLVGLLLCAAVAVAVRRAGGRGITMLSGFRGAFEHAGHGGALLDVHGTVVHVNRALCDILQLPATELEGRSWGDVLPSDATAPDGGERSFRRADGQPRWLAVTCSEVEGDVPEQPVRTVVQVQDVTERKHAELALGASEERFRSAFDETSIGMAIIDAEANILRVNGALEQTILGYGAEELMGRSIVDLTHPEDHASDEEAGVLLFSGEQTTLEQERRYRHRDGWWVWCHLNLSAVLVDGEVRQFVVQVQDVMQRRAVEQFLRESEDRYRSLVEHLPLITYRDRLDEENSVLFMSPQIETLTGHPVQDWIDDPAMLSRAVHPEDRERVLGEIARANQQLADLRCEFRIVHADGRVANVIKEGVVVFDRGMPLYRQGYILDATDRRALEEQLRLAQKLESVGQMASGIAHEINTPIQFVGDSIAFARDAVEDLLGLGSAVHAAIDELPEPHAEATRAKLAAAEEEADLDYLRERLPAAFTRMTDGIERVASIVRAMKAFAHPSIGTHAPVDLNDSIRTTLVVAKAEYKYVADVELDLAADLPTIPGDQGELNQVLLNLIVNAGHAIADHPSDDGARGRIRIITSSDAEEVTVSISDTGGGIPDAIRERIFDPFFTTKAVGRGTGQGLAIARSIVVDSHGGRIDVDSAHGTGTTMSISLPIAAAPAAAEAIRLAEAHEARSAVRRRRAPGARWPA
jgi:PAS domain S-box-containing protein